MKGKKFRVKRNTTHDKGLAGYKYGGLVGEMRYDDPKECKRLTGYPYSLLFRDVVVDGRHRDEHVDGFFKDELEEVK